MVPEEHNEDVSFLSMFLRRRMVNEWSSNPDFYQGFITADITTVCADFLQNSCFAGDAGDLMILTLANVLHMAITVFTSIENMPVLCILPTTGPTVSTQAGPGHYDSAIPVNLPEKRNSVVTKCTCGRKPNFNGVPCTSLRCNCYRLKT